MGHIMTLQKVRLRLETTFSNISPNKRLNVTSRLALWSLLDNLYDSVGFVEVNVPGFDTDFSRREGQMSSKSSKFSGIITLLLTTLSERKTITPVNTLRGRHWDQLRATGIEKGSKDSVGDGEVEDHLVEAGPSLPRISSLCRRVLTQRVLPCFSATCRCLSWESATGQG